jgi:hypothetical protein
VQKPHCANLHRRTGNPSQENVCAISKDTRFTAGYPQMASAGVLHRGNLKLVGHDLAIGYDPGEKGAVTEYLLGRPWMELIHRGYPAAEGVGEQVRAQGTMMDLDSRFEECDQRIKQVVEALKNGTARCKHFKNTAEDARCADKVEHVGRPHPFCLESSRGKTRPTSDD